MLAEGQLELVRNMLSADSPIINLMRGEIEEKISELLDLTSLDTSEEISAENIALEAKARKLASEKVNEIFTHLGFKLEESTKKGPKKSFH